MKKVIYLLAFLFSILLFNSKSYSQSGDIDLIVFTPLPEVDFAAFALANIPSGYTRIFAVNITPAGIRVKMQGRIEWKKDSETPSVNLYSFSTHSFLARNITNQDIGRGDIRIAQSSTNSEATDENLRRGKPSGTYTITLRLLDENGRLLDSDSETLSFVNPAQTLTIRSPEPNSNQDVGTTILNWDGVVGAGSYTVRANIRRNESQSLEEALNQGTPIIDDADVGNLTVVNLRQYYSREPLPGQEVVVRVTAVIPGPGGGTELYSNIVNFFISSSSSPETEATRTRIVNIVQSLESVIGDDFMEMLRNGEIDIASLVITDDNGRRITLGELEQILSYLQANEDALINAEFYQQ